MASASAAIYARRPVPARVTGIHGGCVALSQAKLHTASVLDSGTIPDWLTVMADALCRIQPKH
jgi:hypothetical protein